VPRCQRIEMAMSIKSARRSRLHSTPTRVVAAARWAENRSCGRREPRCTDAGECRPRAVHAPAGPVPAKTRVRHSASGRASVPRAGTSARGRSAIPANMITHQKKKEEAESWGQHHHAVDRLRLGMHCGLLSVTRPTDDRRANALVRDRRSYGPKLGSRRHRHHEKPTPPHASRRDVGCVGWDHLRRVGMLLQHRLVGGKECT
jgi:hypothetical protein